MKYQNIFRVLLTKKIVILLFSASLLAGCATSGLQLQLSKSAAMEKYQSVNELYVLLIKAEKAGVGYLAPEGYSDAQKSYDNALDKAMSQDAEAEKLAQTGLEQLRTAMKNADTSKTIMREALTARAKAQSAAAPTVYPEEYSKLEAKLKKATAAIEHGDMEEAKDLRAELIKEYETLELNSLQLDITQKAKAVIATAREQEAVKYAPKTFKLAEEELGLALNVLKAGRTQTQKAEVHANKAVYFANKSIYITETLKDFKRRDFTNEDEVLWYQKQLELINKPFEKKLTLDDSNHNVVMGIQARINQLIKEKNAAEKSTSEHKQEIASLNKKILISEASMKKQLLDIEEANRKAQARFDKIQSIFTEEESYVYRQGNNMLLETHAFNFKVGGSEINSSNFDLLEKIMQAINVFDNPKIIVTGHTDSTGSTALNMKLSQKRAQTVASFLKKVGKIDSKDINVKGCGETRPVASNKTKDGRERNRRIEVLILNK